MSTWQVVTKKKAPKNTETPKKALAAKVELKVSKKAKAPKDPKELKAPKKASKTDAPKKAEAPKKALLPTPPAPEAVNAAPKKALPPLTTASPWKESSWATVGEHPLTASAVPKEPKREPSPSTKETKEKRTKFVITDATEDIKRHLFDFGSQNRGDQEFLALRREYVTGWKLFNAHCSDCNKEFSIRRGSALSHKVFNVSVKHRKVQMWQINRFECPACRDGVKKDLVAKYESASAQLKKARTDEARERAVGRLDSLKRYLDLLNKYNEQVEDFVDATSFEVTELEPKRVDVLKASFEDILEALDSELSSVDGVGNTALHNIKPHDGSVEDHMRRVAVVQRLIRAVGVDPVNAAGQTPFHLACRRGDWGLAMLLWRLGANPGAVCRRGSNALHYAVLSGNKALAYSLREYFAGNYKGETPLDYAVSTPYAEVVEVMLATAGVADGTPLTTAAKCGNVVATNVLLGAGMNANTATCHPMLEAATLGHSKVAGIYLRQGVPPDLCDEDGRTALHLSAANVHDGVFFAFLRAGATHDVKDVYGRRPVDVAKSNHMRRALIALEFAKSVLAKALEAEKRMQEIAAAFEEAARESESDSSESDYEEPEESGSEQSESEEESEYEEEY